LLLQNIVGRIGALLLQPENAPRVLHRDFRLLLDRIDLHLEVSSLWVEEILANRLEESSKAIRNCVCEARNLQEKRFRGRPGIYFNAQKTTPEIR
jgi:magnesium chelatase family protein